jgi:hypothetical protein
MVGDILGVPVELTMMQLQRQIQRRCASATLLRRHLTAKSFVPTPTWSLKDLNLTNHNHTDPVSIEELQILAKRSLLDVIEDDMRQDLANMLQCLRNVQSVRCVISTAEEIYDVPRGVTKAPVRIGEATTSEKLEAEHVFKSLLLPKTVKQGSHDYFSVVTKITQV